MRVLILGGTRFVGRHLTEAALAAGHRVTLFNRGRTSPGLFPEAEHIQGDRGRDLSLLEGRRWNVAIDVNGYLPKEVRASARLLAGAVESYVYISTISVYSDFKTPGLREDAPLEPPEPGDETLDQVPPRGYGRLKALCERRVEEAVPGRTLVVRPCIVVGPWDPTGRFSYWVERSFGGGEALAPGRPDRPVELIDARDLAAWVVRMADRRETGIYNATGPESTLTMGEMLEACREETGGSTSFTWVSDTFLAERDVRLPFWLPEERFGYNLTDHGRAVSKGLTYQPLARTIRDVHDWVSEDPEARKPFDFPPEREAELLRARYGGTVSP
ncbi:MAG TPA: NAD-dependent epimerase/dehydratase family protein [Thermoanaerobaculia bacterium]|nr:NAD-dependent epimerase/dehydratase family protein [Thermoanaerobaculia bacterium]